jgi:hypothetical protein
MDAPMGNGNNWFIANPNDGTGWKIVQYDHNNALESGGFGLCSDSCAETGITWAITRPTCRAIHTNQLVGPLLSDPDLHARFLEIVKEVRCASGASANGSKREGRSGAKKQRLLRERSGRDQRERSRTT